MSRPDDRRALAARCRGYVSGVQTEPLDRQEECTIRGSGGAYPVKGGSTGYCVLIGQFAVPKGEPIVGGARVVWTDIDEYATFSSEE